jgi:hypothetical protein
LGGGGREIRGVVEEERQRDVLSLQDDMSEETYNGFPFLCVCDRKQMFNIRNMTAILLLHLNGRAQQ